MKNFNVWLCVAVLVFFQVMDVQASTKKAVGKKFKVTTTVGMVSDIVKTVAGDKAEVICIVGMGVDPHLYKPTAKDIKKLYKADIVFYAGLSLEGKMQDALIKVGRKKPVYAVTEKMDEKFLMSPEEFAGHHDPHVWMDAKGWAMAVDLVLEALSEFDKPSAAYYQANAKRLQADIANLDTYIKKIMASIPKDKRVLVTAHDAFGYFGRAYDVEVMGVQGISTESEAGLDGIRKLVETLVKRKIKAVFVESSVSPKNIQALIEGCKASGHDVIIGGELFSDAMGHEGTYEGTYIGMIDHNATTVARALGGEAPAKGMQGKLSHK